MLDADFFSGVGLFVARGFVDREWCERACREMSESTTTPATVQGADGSYSVDSRVRRVRHIEAGATLQAEIESRLERARPRIADHYSVDLTGCQPLQFLRYVEGDYYRQHRDSRHDHQASEVSQQRKISAVIFLNGQTPGPDDGGFGGGSLTLYDLLSDSRVVDRGFPLAIEAGLLVTFPAETRHEVLPVTHGSRFTVATWFH